MPTKARRHSWASDVKRKEYKNPYKTPCTCAVLRYFNILPDSFRYAQCIEDICRLLRTRGWSVRSRRSSINNCTVGQLRKKIKSGKLGQGRFIVRVPGHAMLLDHVGKTIVDTDPRKRDVRRVTHLYLVRKKA